MRRIQFHTKNGVSIFIFLSFFFFLVLKLKSSIRCSCEFLIILNPKQKPKSTIIKSSVYVCVFLVLFMLYPENTSWGEDLNNFSFLKTNLKLHKFNSYFSFVSYRSYMYGDSMVVVVTTMCCEEEKIWCYCGWICQFGS